MALCSTLAGAAASPDPEYLFAPTTGACIHLSQQEVAEFVEHMNLQLDGCVATERELARVYHCGNGGAFLLFWDEKECNAKVKLYNERHSQPKPGTPS